MVNIKSIYCALLVLKLDIFNDVNDVQFLNILFVSVTLLVLLPLKEASTAEVGIIISLLSIKISALTTTFLTEPPSILYSPLSFGSKYVYHLLPLLTWIGIEVSLFVYILTVCGVVPVILPT